ncbi:MAG TPA: lysylphosphatidylglycerol synthase domain-containing protein [Kofleriaceae bacterium]|nr:lysylphosphatidylglycerol synthase domain-containing protein [Kofleriaceae bacterium]
MEAPRGSALRWLRVVALVIGVGAFALLVHRLGWAGVTRVLVDTGWWFAVIAAIDVAGALCDAAGIRTFANAHGDLPYGRAVAAQLGGVAINRVTPGSALGEPVKISLLSEYLPRANAVSTILMFDVTATCIAIAVIVIGVPLTLVFADLPARVELVAWIGAIVLLMFAASLALVVRRGVVATLVAALARLRLVSRARVVAWSTSISEIDGMVRELGNRRSRRAMIWLFASRSLNWVGTVVMLHASGLPITPALVVGLLSVGLLVQWISNIVPLGLGLAEGGNYLLYAALGAPAASGIDFSMVNRARNIVLSAIGLVVLAITSYVDRRRRG